MAYISGKKIAFSSNVNISTGGGDSGGGATWSKDGLNPDIMWAREEFEKAEMEGYPYKTLLLCLSDTPKAVFTVPINSIIVTSDGQLYDRSVISSTTIEHVWDDTNAKTAEYYPSNKLRYMIVFRSENLVSIPITDILYFISNGTVQFLTYDVMWSTLKTFDLVGEGQVKVNSSQFKFDYVGGLERVPSFTMIPPTTDYTIKFESCYALMQLDIGYDTGAVTNFSGWLRYCRSLRENPYINTENATNFGYMCQQCYSLVKYNTLNSSKVTNFSAMFRDCYNLLEADMGDTSSGTSFSSMFDTCKKIETIKNLNLINATSVSSIVYSCEKLKNLDIKNIKLSLQLGSTYWGHLLTLESLLNAIKECHDNTAGTSTLTLTVGSANLSKLANVYVKLVDITDEMRAEDPYIDNKKPFVVCESTDEGAMTIMNYATLLKNWEIK